MLFLLIGLLILILLALKSALLGLGLFAFSLIAFICFREEETVSEARYCYKSQPTLRSAFRAKSDSGEDKKLKKQTPKEPLKPPPVMRDLTFQKLPQKSLMEVLPEEGIGDKQLTERLRVQNTFPKQPASEVLNRYFKAVASDFSKESTNDPNVRFYSNPYGCKPSIGVL